MIRSVVILFYFIVLSSCRTPKKDSTLHNLTFTLNGDVKAFKDSTLIYLSRSESDIVDSTYIINGQFTFSGTLNDSIASQYIVYTKGHEDYKFIWLENDIVNFKSQKGNFFNAEVSGSETEETAKKFELELQPLYSKIDSLNKCERLSGNDLSEERNVLLDKIKEREIGFVVSYPKSIISISILSVYCRSWGRVKTASLFNKMPASIQRTSYGKVVKSFLTFSKEICIGDTIGHISLLNSTGKVINLSDYKGEVVLLDFWASWCTPCRKENPNLVNVYKDFHDQGFEIFSFSLDRNRKNWMEAIEKDKINVWHNAIELDSLNQHLPEIYSVSSLPDNFLIDKAGVLVARNLRGHFLRDSVASMLK